MIEHPDVETLSAYADRELAGAALMRAESHLGGCASCRERLERVRALVRDAGALPREVAPPPEVWETIRTAVRARSRRRPWLRLAALAAAAVVVLAVGLQLASGPGRSAKIHSAPPPPTPTALLAVDRNYQPSIAELRRTLDQQRGTLSPATVRVLERSMAVIDTAIAEARAALAADPANELLSGILSAQYEHKVDLLQRATKLSPTT